MALKVEHLAKQFDRFKKYINNNLSQVDFGDYDPFDDEETLVKNVEASQELEALVKDIRELATQLNRAFKDDINARQDAAFDELKKDPERARKLIQLVRQEDETAEDTSVSYDRTF